MNHHSQPTFHHGQPDFRVHSARDLAFLAGVRQSRQHLLTWDVTHFSGWHNANDVLSFVLHEIGTERQTYEEHASQSGERAPHTPMYRLGMAAGFLGVFAKVALTSSSEAACSSPSCDVFTSCNPLFLTYLRQGEDLYQQEHERDIFVEDHTLPAFYQTYLTPFACDPSGGTGVLLGWMRAFLRSGLPLAFSADNGAFVTGYSMAFQDWRTWRTPGTLTESTFAQLLAREVAPTTLAFLLPETAQQIESYQIGYIFGLVRALLVFSDMQITGHPAEKSTFYVKGVPERKREESVC